MTSGGIVTISRMDLYERAWSTPIQTLAGEWGISDVGLAKICERHSIPRPPRGYWEKRKHGKYVSRPPLPPIDDDRLSTITFLPIELVDESSIVDSQIERLIARESESDRAIEVSENLRIRHPIVRATKEALQNQKPNEYGRVVPSRQHPATHFDVQVSPKNVPRALRILEALTSAMQARGFALKVPNDRSRCPRFDVLGETFEVTLRERATRSKRKQNENPRDLWYGQRYDYTPTGVIELCLNYGGYSSDAVVRDTKKVALEARLNKVVVELLKLVDRRRREAERRRVEAAQKAERKRIAFENEIANRSDVVRIERLNRLTTRWKNHQRVTAFVDTVRHEAERRATTINPDVLDWLTWADAYLRENDPLCGGEELPTYSLTSEEIDHLRSECEADWESWSEQFRPRQPR